MTIGGSTSRPIVDSYFLDGGPLMLFSLPLIVLWLWFTIFFLRGRLRRTPWVLFVFPLGFGLFALFNWVFRWHFSFLELLETVPDPFIYAHDALIVSRTTLFFLLVAGVSFLSACLLTYIARDADEKDATE